MKGGFNMNIVRKASAARILGAFFLCTPFAVVFMSNRSSIKPAVIIQEPVVVRKSKAWVSQPVPNWRSSGLVIFGKNGDVFLASRGRLLVSHDQGNTWSNLEGGYGSYRATTDGGLTYIDAERRTSRSSWIGIDELCSVESGAVTKSGRLYLTSVCEHTAQIWSIPVSAPGSWFVTGFTYASDPADGVYGPRPDLIARENLVTVTGTLSGGWAILTTEDAGFSWKPLSKLYDPRGIRGFDFFDSSRGVLLLSNGDLLMTTDGGKSWKPIVSLPTEIAKRANSIRFGSSENLLIAGNQGMVMTSTDNGITWCSYSIEPSIDWYNIVTGGQDRAWISGNSNVVIETGDLGQSWRSARLPFDRDLYHDVTSDGHNAWVTSGESVLHSLEPEY